MLLGARLGMSGGGAAPLPYDAEVEYLETDGASWIDTSVQSLSVDTELTITMEKSSSSVNHVTVGCRNFVYLAWINAQNKLQNYASSVGAGLTPTWSGMVTFTSTMGTSGSSMKFGTTTVTSTRTILAYAGYHFAIFAAACTGESYNGNYYRSPSGERIAGVTFKQSGVVVADFVPVRVGDVGYMYDRVSGELFDNSGTGAFILGPDK